MVELDGEVQAEAIEGLEAGDLVAVAHFHRLADADEALGRFLLGDARRLQQEHERARGAVHDRHFGGRQFHIDVVDAQPGQRRQQVFDGLDLGRAAGQAGAQRGLGDQLGLRGHFHHRVQIDAAEHDAGIDRGRTQREKDLLSAVQAHAGGADHVLEGALAQHRGSLGDAFSSVGTSDVAARRMKWFSPESAGKDSTRFAES